MISAENTINMRHWGTHLGEHHQAWVFCKEVHRKQGFTNPAVWGTNCNTVSTRKLASYLPNHFFFFMDCFFLAIELSDSNSYIHFTNFLVSDRHSLKDYEDTDRHSLKDSQDFVSLSVVLLCLLQFPWRAGTCTAVSISMTFVPQGLRGLPISFYHRCKQALSEQTTATSFQKNNL